VETGRVVVLYDQDCGFCRWSSDVLRRWDRRGRLRFVPIRSAEGTELLRDVPQDRRLTSWHVVTPDGRVRSSGAAVPALASRLPLGGSIAWLARRFPAATERGYAWVARNRTRLGALLGADRCAVDPSRPAARTR